MDPHQSALSKELFTDAKDQPVTLQLCYDSDSEAEADRDSMVLLSASRLGFVGNGYFYPLVL